MADYFVGIDPGLTGGLAILDRVGGLESLLRFDGQDPLSILRAIPEFARVGLESVGARPGQGVVSMFNFGRGLGRIEGYLEGRSTLLTLVSPQAWHRWLPEHPDAKTRAKLWVEERYGLGRFIFPGCRVPHSGCVDAAGIAEYMRRLHIGMILPPKPCARGKKRRPMKL